MGNNIRLYCGRIIEGYPKEDIHSDESEEMLTLDTTGKYLCYRHPKTGPDSETGKDEQAHRALFTDNAFLILANHERILSDSRLFLTHIPVGNNLAYTGELPSATLGVYVEWWLSTPQSVLFWENDEMSLVWYLAGSPLSGTNKCSTVYEDGRTENVSVPSFMALWHPFMKILSNYIEAKRLYQAYTLHEAITVLRKETSTEKYMESIKDFVNRTKFNLNP